MTYKEARLYGVDVHTVAFHRSLKMPDVSMTDLESALQSWVSIAIKFIKDLLSFWINDKNLLAMLLDAFYLVDTVLSRKTQDMRSNMENFLIFFS